MHQIVLHASAPGVPEGLRAFAAQCLWAHLIARQGALPAALAELRCHEQRELYEPLLRLHAAEAYQAIWPEGIGGAGGEEEVQEEELEEEAAPEEEENDCIAWDEVEDMV